MNSFIASAGSFKVVTGPAAVRSGRYWIGYASGHRTLGIRRVSPDRALEDARRLEAAPPAEAVIKATGPLSLNELCDVIKANFGDKVTITQREHGLGSASAWIKASDGRTATWRAELKTIPPLDGKTPRGPREYLDLTIKVPVPARKPPPPAIPGPGPEAKIFIDAAERIWCGQEDFACHALSHARETRCFSLTPERALFKELFPPPPGDEPVTPYFGRYDDPLARESRVLALLFCAAVLEDPA